MGLAELFVQKKQAKRQSKVRSAYAGYSDAYKALALEQEVDHDELELILESAGKTESDLLSDVKYRRDWLGYYSQLQANQQAAVDRRSAEAALAAAQLALDAAVAKLEPAVIAARQRLDAANHAALITMSAEEWLCGHVQDVELIERERAVSAELRDISTELRPLEQDRIRKQAHLSNLESRLAELRSSASVPWLEPVVRPWLGRVRADIGTIEARIADVRSQLKQLDAAIEPRLKRRVELQRELSAIHAEKLLP